MPPLKKKKAKNLPLVHALLWIVGSTLFISGFSYRGFSYYLQHQRQKQSDPSQLIQAVIQTGPQKEALRTDYLVELMDLSCERKIPLCQFDLKHAKERLLKSPVIKEAEVKALLPSTLYVDYVARQPKAWLFDYENTAIDEEGYFFTVYPFFTPKNLPEIYLGLPLFEDLQEWRIPLGDERLELAYALLKIATETKALNLLHVKRIDVSNAFAMSYGVREIVMICEDVIGAILHTRFLRLSPKNYPQELGNYLKLREQLIDKERHLATPTTKVIDLRLSKLGYIEEL